MSKAAILSAMSVLFIVSLGMPPAIVAADPDPGIEQAARDYLEGWFEGNAERMERALHPALAKRAFLPDRTTGEVKLQEMTKEQLVDYTRRGGGSKTGVAAAQITVQILDVSKDIATVKTTCKDFTDYLHLARVEGQWKIVNVLWELK
jgi:hypothetical protein